MVEPWRHKMFWQQPGAYFPGALYKQVGSFDEGLRYVFDRDWMCRALQNAPVHYLHHPIAQFRYHAMSKTVGEAEIWFEEERVISIRYRHIPGQPDEQLATAAFEMHRAETYLRFYNWNRSKGLLHLKRAGQLDYRLLAKLKFWLLCLKGIIPVGILRILRISYLRYLRQHLFG